MDTATMIVMGVLIVILAAMVGFAYRALRGDWYDPEPRRRDTADTADSQQQHSALR